MTKVRALPLWLCLITLAAGCGGAGVRGDEVSGARASELVRRNLLSGQERFPIDDARAYQYGNVHVDGPAGGMLYRFGSDAEALEWMVEQHRLLETPITSPRQLPLEFLDFQPRWWDPWQANPSVYYILAENFATGGERQLIVVFDRASGIFYAVEHYSKMPGI